jgi:hypothetical protein
VLIVKLCGWLIIIGRFVAPIRVIEPLTTRFERSQEIPGPGEGRVKLANEPL